MNYKWTPHRGFTIIEMAIVMFIVCFLAVLLWPNLTRVHRVSRRSNCQTNLKNVSVSLENWASSHIERFPIPLDHDAATANASIAPGNSTANMFSMMIFGQYSWPDVLICPSEESSFVNEKINYDFGDQESGSTLDGAMAWDPTFDCEITGRDGRVSNVSYASLAPVGDRFNKYWTRSFGPMYAIVGDRGPRDGNPTATSTLDRNHDSRGKGWNRNILFSDGHVKDIDGSSKDANPFPVSGMSWPTNDQELAVYVDNAYKEDDPRNGADTWLGIFVQDTSDPTKYVPLWD